MKRYSYVILFVMFAIPAIVYTNNAFSWIPPTNAFDKIHTDNGTITAMNSSMPFIIKGGSGVNVQSSNTTHTVTISTAGSFGSGSYNTTQANNVNVNSGGYKINFINGSGATVHIQDSSSGTQVNVTISSTGIGGISSISNIGKGFNSTGILKDITSSVLNAKNLTGSVGLIVSENTTDVTLTPVFNFIKSPMESFRLDNNTQDSSSVIDGSIGHPGITYVQGILGKAATTNGSGYITIPNSWLNRPTNGTTLIGWFNLPATAGGDGEKDLIRKDSAYYFRVDPDSEASNRFSFFFFTQGAVLHDRLSYTYTPGKWFNAAGVYDSTSGLWKLYINGTQKASTTLSSGLLMNHPNNPLGIFGSGSGSVKAKSGTEIDEFYLFDYALNQDEIQKIVNMKCC